MMSNMSWVTSWEAWRQAMGPRGSRQRRNVETFLQTHPAILYWGDSWFSTPLYLNLARQSMSRINGMGMIIGKPGALAADLFSSKEVDRVFKRIQNNPFDVVCLSAGGNDCLDDRLADIFPAWTKAGSAPRPATLSADQAYAIFEASGALDRIFDAYDRLLARIKPLRQSGRQIHVVGHPYVPIEFVGRQADLTTGNIGLIAWVKNSVGPWLWKPMQHVLHDQVEAKAFARRMLEIGFRQDVLGRLEGKYTGLFSVADFSTVPGIADPGFWNDEIHPSETGFARLAGPFNTTVRDSVAQAKQAAVST